MFVLEPEAVHTGMAAVPEGWAYKVLYIEPRLLHEWAERDDGAPRAARWVVFRDVALRARSSVPTPRSPPSPQATGDRRGGAAARSPRSARICVRARRRGNASAPSTPRSAGPGVTCASDGTSESRWRS